LKGPAFNTRKKRGRRKGDGREKSKRKGKREREGKGESQKGGKRSTPSKIFGYRSSLILKFWCNATLVCPYMV